MSDELEAAKANEDYDKVAELKAKLAGGEPDTSKRSEKAEKAVKK